MKTKPELGLEVDRLERLIGSEENEQEREMLMTIRDTILWVLGQHEQNSAPLEIYGK